MLYFNPRSHEGSDKSHPVMQNHQSISIHAPTRGATGLRQTTGRKHKNFNPRSHEGSDDVQTLNAMLGQIFQSTLPRGERLAMLYLPDPLIIFQSTLPRGERPNIPSTLCQLLVFQSTLPRGERRNHSHGSAVFQRFQSTLPRGERQNILFHNSSYSVFQSTLPRGERRGRDVKSHRSYNISIHAPTRGAT